MDQIPVKRHPTLLVILDGVGIGPADDNNALAVARTPTLDRLFSQPSFTTLKASGSAVGLPEGQMGNSEVGHVTMGCGSILRQDLVRIDDSIKDGSFYKNPQLLAAVIQAKKHQKPVHLIGLVSDGGVHSHVNHLVALISMCKHQGVRPMVHMITDGRDTPPQSALRYLEQVETALEGSGGGIATVSGRYFAMDRDKRWERTHAAWDAICFGEGPHADSPREAIESAYEQGITDEFIQPTVIDSLATVEKEDQVIFFNFRNDRARQLTYVLAGKNFKPFDRGVFCPVTLTCLTEYDPELNLPIAFPPESPDTTLAKVISDQGIGQFHCAETEKYAHVTFFFNGGKETPFPGEDRTMIPSPEVATYDLAPAMSAHKVANTVIDALESQKYGFVLVNFANGDMVGHTAIRDAVINAVEALDKEVGRIVDAARTHHWSVVITADHGNCDMMVDPETGQPHTQHTTRPVPCVVLDDEVSELSADGGLANIAPTVLELMGIEVPKSMTAHSLIHWHSRHVRKHIA